MNAGDASISDYVKSIDPTADAKLKDAIQKAIASIKAIPEPFAKNTNTAAAREAVTVVGTDLVKVLEEVNQVLSKY